MLKELYKKDGQLAQSILWITCAQLVDKMWTVFGDSWTEAPHSLWLL
jgi:hypothetical protein